MNAHELSQQAQQRRDNLAGVWPAKRAIKTGPIVSDGERHTHRLDFEYGQMKEQGAFRGGGTKLVKHKGPTDLSNMDVTGVQLPSGPLRLVETKLTRASLRHVLINGSKIRTTNLNDLQAAVDCRRWRELGLMPIVERVPIPEHVHNSAFGPPPPLVLVWKHVVHDSREYGWNGNLGAPYEIGVPYTWACMVTAGPAGAVRDWSHGDDAPHVMSIAGVVSEYDSESGIFYALFGIPQSVYRATPDSSSNDWILDLVDGVDTLPLIS